MAGLPKGYGSVVKMKGKRIKPYMIRVSDGTYFNEETEKCYVQYKVIGYAKTKAEAISMLERYHEAPFDVDNEMTFADVFKKMFDETLEDKSHSTHIAYAAAFKAVPVLHNMKFKDIKVIHLQKAIDKSGKNYPTMKKIKVMYNVMYKYGMKYDICPRDLSSYVDIIQYHKRNPKKEDRNPFTIEQINTFWSLSEDMWYDVILILIYTGVRIGELLELKKEDIHLDEQWFQVTQSKTESGIRRVPIADSILPFFQKWHDYSEADTLLCTPDMEPFKYRNYYDSYWKPLIENLNLGYYTPHCTRHTCISLLAEARVDQTSIKKIVGHAGAMTLTERVYTHLDIGVLIAAVNQMYVPEGHRQVLKK